MPHNPRPRKITEVFLLELTHCIEVDVPEFQEHIRVVAEPKYTHNMYGPIKAIAGKRLLVVDNPKRGRHCLCIVEEEMKQPYLCDIDKRDIKPRDKNKIHAVQGQNQVHQRKCHKT